MRFGERLAIFVVRPIYRTFLERPFWWFLAKIKAFFFAEIVVQLGAIENRLHAMEGIERRLHALEQSAGRATATTAAEWDALEQLLLALFRQPELRSLEPGWNVTTPEETSISSATDLNRAHAASPIR